MQLWRLDTKSLFKEKYKVFEFFITFQLSDVSSVQNIEKRFITAQQANAFSALKFFSIDCPLLHVLEELTGDPCVYIVV